MPYFQCPRCGGTDSFGQWEQRFNSQNISYRDNHNRQVGTSNGGFGVSNVRQQYCRSCMSVKMDLKFTQKDFKILGIAILLFLGVSLILNLGGLIITGISALVWAISVSLPELSLPQDTSFFIFSSGFFLLGLLVVATYRKLWIRKEDKKFLRDRFYRPKPPRSKKLMFVWFTLLFAFANLCYLIYVG